MARNPLPDDLKELISLCRAGRLFDVQRWIEAGKRFTLPPGNFTTSPLRASIEKGFHSMVEVLVKADSSQEQLDSTLIYAIRASRLDIVELLASQGAKFDQVRADEVLYTRNPLLIRWFVDHGLNMEDGFPIAHAFRDRHREFLGIFMGIRDEVPSACIQAAMALRVHCREGNLKWVSLLLWAGADPRMVVPDMENSPPEEFAGTALDDAVHYGKLDIVRKIGINPERDNLIALLAGSSLGCEPEVVKILLAAGADPNGFSGEESPMQSFMRSFGWSLDNSFLRSNPDPKIKCIEILASHGGRWRPKDAYEISSLRRDLGRAEPSDAVRGLERIIKSGAIEKDVFLELMRTPKMRLLMNSGHPGSVFLRECSGQIQEPPRKPTARGRRRL